ncbi:hypothetical protein N657DRAFT_633524 [Parathielavia appendiculata]|uniref:Uncharacterized protein n=1 Tax=Parathielavia appendiculata TaxID=2587402 RepID=A0AAN6Z4E0_9PEZI|nr:hypothetical protein N657DRAFT_633524 [Parathielavia appendiculata]
MPRAEQYTKNESDLYVSGLAEEGLDEGNPFQQDAEDEPITDPDEAAVAAVLSRDENAAPDAKDYNGGHDQAEHSHQPRSTNIFIPKEESAVGSELEDVNSDLAARPPEHVESSSKHGRAEDADAIGDAADEFDRDVQRLVKRARHDSRALLIKHGDDVEEQECKMHANLDLRAPVIENDEHKDNENGSQQTGENDFDRPKEVAPMPRIEQLSGHKDHESVPRDAGDEDDDVETKGGDDYDVENYAEFEDDDDDMEGPTRDTVGSEELVIDENNDNEW